MSLRSRLFASYLVLMLVVFSIVSAALLLFLSARPEPVQTTYQRLTRSLSALDFEELGLQFFATNPDRETATPAELYTLFSQNTNSRMLQVGLSSGLVYLDTDQTFALGDVLTTLTLSDYRPAPDSQQSFAAENLEGVFGSFEDPNGEVWYFAGVNTASGQFEDIALLIATPQETERSLQAALADFSSALATPILQAGLVGLLMAFVLAAWISRTIAGPLQTFANAAGEIAAGHYEQSVAVTGAPELRAVAEAINSMSREVHDTQQSQRDFMANVSHDLKTPLTSIQGYSQAIMDGAAREPEKAAAIIHEEAERLTRMVTALTELARLQSGGITMQREAIDLQPLTQAIVQRLTVVADQKHITLATQLADGLVIQGDGDRMAQVLTNLISNAVKYTPTGGHVEVSGQRSPNQIRICVSDNGIGIAKEELPRIFERFYQVDRARGPQRGTGLGLAIAREIVEAHGGRIQVDSPGRSEGATFTITLPVYNGEPASRVKR